MLRLHFAWGCCFTPFDALGLLWNLFCFWFICSAPVRGGTHFLCCCKESKQRKQLPNANPCQCASRPFPRSGPTGGVSLAGFHRCWHVEEARTSHRDREWTSSHTSSLALRAHPSGKTETQHPSRYHHPTFVLDACFNLPLSEPVVGHEVPGRMNDCCSTPCRGAMCAPFLHANNDETPLTTLPRLDHSERTVWRHLARICVVKLLSLLTFFAAAKKVSPAPDRGRANKPKTKQVP